jgi:hypothetical protein
MKASLQTISTLVMEDISIESNMRKRERPSSPLTNTGGAPTKRAFRRLDSDCAADCEAFIPSEEEECPHIRVRKAMLAQMLVLGHLGGCIPCHCRRFIPLGETLSILTPCSHFHRFSFHFQ